MTKYTRESTQFIREHSSDLENLKNEFDLGTEGLEEIRIQLVEKRITKEQCKRKEKMLMHNTKISLNVYSNKLKSRLPNYYKTLIKSDTFANSHFLKILYFGAKWWFKHNLVFKFENFVSI